MSNQDDSEDVKRKKDLIFYEASLNAWVTTRMEMDKSFLWISTAGIGVLLNLPPSIHCPTLWWIATIAFLIAAITIVFTFDWNSDYIEDMIKESKRMSQSKRRLEILHQVTKFTFLIGLIFSILTFLGR